MVDMVDGSLVEGMMIDHHLPEDPDPGPDPGVQVGIVGNRRPHVVDPHHHSIDMTRMLVNEGEAGTYRLLSVDRGMTILHLDQDRDETIPHLTPNTTEHHLFVLPPLGTKGGEQKIHPHLHVDDIHPLHPEIGVTRRKETGGMIHHQEHDHRPSLLHPLGIGTDEDLRVLVLVHHHDLDHLLLDKEGGEKLQHRLVMEDPRYR